MSSFTFTFTEKCHLSLSPKMPSFTQRTLREESPCLLASSEGRHFYHNCHDDHHHLHDDHHHVQDDHGQHHDHHHDDDHRMKAVWVECSEVQEVAVVKVSI